MKTVYLAGPIAGHSYNGATAWREHIQQRLAAYGIKALSPMRGKEHLNDETELDATARPMSHLGLEALVASDNPLSTPRAVMCRDFFDATRCDVMLVNLAVARKVSIGTVMEIAWAYQKRIPIVALLAGATHVHDHIMINEAIDFPVRSVDEAVAVITGILA